MGRQDVAMKAREQALQAAEEHQRKVAAARQQRKHETELLRKRTRSGQPVMKFRIDKLLGKLQGHQQA